MEEFIAKSLPSLGSAGMISAVLWYVAKRFMDETMSQVKQTQDQMTSRIVSLERGMEECAKDRRQMHEELLAIVKRAHE